MILGASKEEIKFVTKRIRGDFQRRYGDGESLRQTFFEQQNGLCILCHKPMQGPDTVLVNVEHMIPVRVWAEFYVSGMPIEKVLVEANDFKNLRLSHIACGRRKDDSDFEELPQSFFDDSEPHFLTQNEIQKQKEAAKTRAIYRGKIRGPQAVASGQLLSICSKGGKIQGQRNVETGHLRVLDQGRKNKESGHMALLGREWGRKTGSALGRSGLGNHVRHHVHRGITSPKCSLCQEEAA